MKNILNKIYIDPSTYIILFIALITGMFKSISIILLIVIFHELGHIITLKKYDYKVKKIEIYPFGGITKTEKIINSPINEELIISISGIIFQLILAFAFRILHDNLIINLNTYSIFTKYNLTIIVFNLLPIVPLDGSIFFKSILEKLFSFKTAHIITVVISVIFIILFATYNYIYSINNYIIITFLIYKTFISIKEFKYTQNRFYLERYLYELPYKSIKNEKKESIKSLRKETLHFFKRNNKYVHEKTILAKLFDIKS